MEATSKLDSALEFYTKSLCIWREIMSGNNVELARIYNNIGTVL
jgi:hypothetical protein